MAEALAVPPELSRYLVDGSVDPDRNPDFVMHEGGALKRIAHHNPSIQLITEYSWISRKLLLSGDILSGMFELGRALHYLQDWCIGFENGREHDRLEKRMTGHQIDRSDVIRGIRMAKSSTGSIKKLLKKIEPKRRAGRSLRLAAELSGWLAATVLDTSMGDLVKKYCIKWKSVFLFVGIPAGILPFIGWMLGFISMKSPAGMGFLICGFIILLTTFLKYRRLRKEAKWYGY